MQCSLVDAPDDYPITLGDVRRQTKTEGLTADDTLIEDIIIPSVVDRGQQACDRQFFEADWLVTLDAFPCADWIELPKPPLVVGSVVITYVDAAGVTQTFASAGYQVVAPAGPHCARGRVALKTGYSWPATKVQLAAVTIAFTAGYGAEAEDVPARLRMAMLLDAATLYRNREHILTGKDAAAIELPLGSSWTYRQFKSRGIQRL